MLARVCAQTRGLAARKFARERVGYEFCPYGGKEMIVSTKLPDGTRHGCVLRYAPSFDDATKRVLVAIDAYSWGVRDGPEVHQTQNGSVYKYQLWYLGTRHGPLVTREIIKLQDAPPQQLLTHTRYVHGQPHGQTRAWIEIKDRTVLLPTQSRTNWHWYGEKCHRREFEQRLARREREEERRHPQIAHSTQGLDDE